MEFGMKELGLAVVALTVFGLVSFAWYISVA
jgi:hypothetical protein